MNYRTIGLSRRARVALFCALPLLVQACNTLSNSGVVAPQQDVYQTYTERLKANVGQLRQLTDVAGGKELPFSVETLETIRDGAAALQGEMTRYVEIAERAKRFEPSVAPETLERGLEQLSQLERSLRQQAVTLSVTVDGLENQYESLRLGGGRDLGSAESYLATARRTASLARTLENCLVGLHVRAVRPYASNVEPAKEVFHFLRLTALRYSRLNEHSGFFMTAWNRWLDRAFTENRPGVALGVLALVAQNAREDRPASPQAIFEITASVLDQKLNTETLESMSQAIVALRSVSGTLPNPAAWERACGKAKARILFCGAVASAPSDDTVHQAVQALEGDRELASHVSRYLSVAGLGIARQLVNTNNYAEALDALKRTLETGSGAPDRSEIFAQFRADTFERALSDVRDALEIKNYSQADRLLNAATRLPKTEQEMDQILALRWQYFDTYSRELLATDPEKSLQLARETLRTFPDDDSAQVRIDRILLARLEKEVGALDTAHQRIGGAAILTKVGQAVKSMMTDAGTANCQRLLELAEVNWRRQVRTTGDAEVAFLVEIEIGRLNGLSAEISRHSGIASIWQRFNESASRGDWATLGSCIDLYFREFPEQQRPSSFKNVYVDYLKSLDREKDVQTLGRHAALFVVAYPKDTHRVRSLVAKHANDPGPLSREFSALLASIAAPVQTNTPRTAGAEGSQTEVDPTLTALVPKGVLAKIDTWWQEPEPSHDELPSAAAAPPARPSIGLVGILLAVGSALGVIALCALTFLRGFLSFRWYVLASFAVGITAGYLLDRLPNERSTQPQESSIEAVDTLRPPEDTPPRCEAI